MSIGVEKPYTVEDADALWTFLRNGGNIILADDFGYGNTFWDSNLNEGYGRAEFQKKQLFDPNYIKNTTFVTVHARLPDANLGWYNLLLNAPTALEKSYGYTDIITLAQSSKDSWLDKNKNRVRDPPETKSAYPIIMYFQLSKYSGKVIIMSDPGIFINENWDRLDNSEYILDLIHYLLPTGGDVIFDESRHITEDTFENGRRMVYSSTVFMTSSAVSILLVVIMIVTFTLWLGVKIKPQNQWRNENLLDNKFFNVLMNPYISRFDHWQIYYAFLERVRQSYGFTSEDFNALDRDTLYNLIQDEVLWDFITYRLPMYVDEYYYTMILNKIIDWEPRLPGVDVGIEVEPIKEIEWLEIEGENSVMQNDFGFLEPDDDIKNDTAPGYGGD